MKHEQRPFGVYQGNAVTLHTLTNDHQMSFSVMDLGATITQIILADGTSIACGFDMLEDYLSETYTQNAPYFGCTVGRYCSQIKDATFSIDEQVFHLAKNCGENNLHGGKTGFDKKMWKTELVSQENGIGIKFSLVSPDGEEGFPGEVLATVLMMLTNNNEVVLSYNATTTQKTPLSMTNHTYFNLSGFADNVDEFIVEIPTSQLMETDSSGAATGNILDVTNSPNDLRQGRSLKEVHQALGEGMEHFYVYPNPEQQLNLTAKVVDPKSKRSLEVYSTEPCMLFYTAKYMSNDLMRHQNERYGKHRAFACETHRWQNGVNIAESPCSFTNPKETFSSQTVYKFTV